MLKWTNRRQQNMLFLLCWTGYVTVYLGRYNLSAALTDMVAQDFLTKSQGGLIATSFFVTYGACQIISGLLGDRINARLMVGIGLGVSGLMNLCIGLMPSWEAVLILWMINEIAQSMVWSPMLRLIAEELPRERSLKAGVDIATTVPAGSILSYALTALSLLLVGWRGAFIAPGVLLLVIFVVWMIGVGRLQKTAERGVIEEGEPLEGLEKATKGHRSSLMFLLIHSGLLIAAAAVMLQGAVRDSVTTWMPTYLTEDFGLSAEIASISSMALPIVNLIGVYGAAWLNKKVLKDEMATAALLFFFAAVSLGVIVGMKKPPLLAAILILAFANASMHAINTMLISLLPMYFTKSRRVSTITGLLNAVVYVGSAVSAYGIGAVSDTYGWGMTRWIWCGFCVLGSLLLVGACLIWIPYKKKSLAEDRP